MGLAIIATKSLAAVLSITLTLIIGLIFFSSLSKRKIILATLTFLVVSGSYFYFTGRLSYLALPLATGEANSISVRFQLWSISLGLIKDNPLLGIGLGTFEPAYQQKLHERFQKFEKCESLSLANRLTTKNCLPPLAEYVFRDPHNCLLSFWLNTGLLGLLSFAGIHFIIIKKIFLSVNKKHQSLPVALALLALLIFGLFDTIYWKNDLSALHWALIALAINASLKTNHSSQASASPLPKKS